MKLQICEDMDCSQLPSELQALSTYFHNIAADKIIYVKEKNQEIRPLNKNMKRSTQNHTEVTAPRPAPRTHTQISYKNKNHKIKDRIPTVGSMPSSSAADDFCACCLALAVA